MSTGKVVKLQEGVRVVSRLLRAAAGWRTSACSPAAIVMFGVAVAGCEQQVASAEQPAKPASASAALKAPEPAKTSPVDLKGKLVFDKPACELPNRGGEVTGECSVLARVGREPMGHLTYGPYLPLEAGEYVFEVEYRSAAEKDKPAGRWDVAARLGPEEQVLLKGDIVGTGNQLSTLGGRFAMPSREGKAVLEVRMSPGLESEAEIKRLRIYEAAPAE